MQIYHNLAALLSYNKVSALGSNMSKTIQKLSTGLRINSAADDAAGLAISEKMASQVRGLDQARRNAQDGISLLQTAEGALQSVHSMLQRMRELAVQAANDVLTSQDRAYIQAEIEELTNQVNAVAKQTQFNKKKILDGSSAILWSTSTSDIKVIVAGTLLTKDHLGTVNNAEGNYKITFNALQTGMEQVQKSNILTLKHGTVDDRMEFSEGTGVQSVDSLNLVEGIWGLEARGEAFGGVRYYHGANEYATTTLGMTGVGEQVNASADGKLADGTYEVRLSEKLPMMASFDESVVNNVNMSNRNASADFDATLNVDTNTTSTSSTTTIYRDDSNGAIAAGDITTKADANINVFTRYEVTGTDRHDLITGALTFETDYVSAGGAVDAVVSYQTVNATSTVGATLNYVSGGDSIVIRSLFYFGGAIGSGTQTITFTNDKFDATINPTQHNLTVDVSGRTMDQAMQDIYDGMNALGWISTYDGSGALLVANGIEDAGSFDRGSGQKQSSAQIMFDNQYTITITGSAAATMGFVTNATDVVSYGSGQDAAHSGTVTATPRYDEDRGIQIDGLLGMNLDQIADYLTNTAGGTLVGNNSNIHTSVSDVFKSRGIVVSAVEDTAGSGIKHLEFTQIGTNTRYDIEILAQGAPLPEVNPAEPNPPLVEGTLITELGLLGGQKLLHDPTAAVVKSGEVYDGAVRNINITLNSSISSVKTQIDTQLSAIFAGTVGSNEGTVDTTLAPNLTNGTNSLTVQNNSIYRITLEDISGGVLSELLNTATPGVANLTRAGTGATNTANGNTVFDNKTITVNIPSGSMINDIETALSNQIQAAMNAAIPGSGRDFFVADAPTNATTITMRNLAGNIYSISIADATGAGNTVVNTLWGASQLSNRGDLALKTSSAMAAHQSVGTVTFNNVTIETAFTDLQNFINSQSGLAGLLLQWVQDPTSPANELHGQLRLVNNSAGANAKRFIITQSGTDGGGGDNDNVIDAFRTLFTTNAPMYLNTTAPSNTVTSRAVQAKDIVMIELNAEGNRADTGAIISNTTNVRLWVDNGTTTGNPAAAANLATLNGIVSGAGWFGPTSGAGFYTKIDTTGLAIGNSWILYTNATGAANSNHVTLELYDGKYTDPGTVGGNNGGLSTINYYFSDNALLALGSNANYAINQMIRASASDYETLRHNIDFATVSNTNIQYGERKDAGNATEWALGSGVNAWYGQAYYGGDTTYFFANPAANATNVVTNAKVTKQNEINATLMFRYLGNNQFEVQMKGYDRDGNVFNGIGTGTGTVNALTQAALIADMSAQFGIDFTTLAINTGNLTVNDKFVINVAAAAMFDGLVNTTPATAAGFISGDNIAIKGDPLNQNSTGSWGTTAQYRFVDNVSGKPLTPTDDPLYLLGFIIDPLLGADNNDGTGWYSGQLELRDDGTSTSTQFATDSGVGEVGFRGASGTDPNLAYWVRVEVIDGQARSLSKSNVTSVYMQKLENGSGLSLNDFIKRIHYSNYLYDKEVPLDGKQKFGAQYTAYNPYNAEVIFDVLEVSNHVLKLRAQAHIVDLDGVYRYAEDEEIYLNDGENTNNTVLRLFAGNGFDGLLFDEFTLGSYENWTVGDRFTLSLTASGEESPDINEIILQSDQRGTNNPHAWRFRDGVLENTKTDLHMYQLAHNLFKPDSDHFSSNQVMDGTVTVGIGSSIVKPMKIDPNTGSAIPYDPLTDWKTGFPTSASVIFQTLLKRGIDAGIAHYYSKSEDIAQFWDGNGKFIMDSGSQIMTVVKGNDEFNIAIGARLEMGYLARMISEQIYDKLLSDNPVREEDKYRIFRLVNTVPGNNPLESVVGTFLSHSVIPGNEDAIRFFGSEDLMKAFGFATIQKAEDDMFWINVSDAHTGRFVTSTKASAGGVSYGLISPQINVELDISGDIGLKQVQYSDWAGSFTTKLQESFSHYVHLADNASHLQIGANEGENMMLVLGDMSANALGIDSLELRDRALAARAITQIDNAIDKVSTQRARIGSSINRLDHTIENLTTSSTNLVAAQSRIRDTDYAKVMMQFVKYQILMQSGTSMLGQANQLGANVLQLLSM